jgi:chromosome segregation ATPase
MASNCALRASLAAAEEKVEKVDERVALCERERDDARKKEIEAEQKVQRELENIAQLREAIEAAEKLKQQAEEATQMCREEVAVQLLLKEKAEEDAAHARSNEVRASAEYKVKAEEASSLFNECATLRVEMARVNEKAEQADERATAAELGETTAKATLKVKSNDVDRIMNLNVELRTEVSKAQDASEEASKRASAAEGSVDAAHRARDQAYAELRGKVTALEAMAMKMSSLRVEVAATAKAQAKAEAEAVAKKSIEEAEKQASSALENASEARRGETDALARLQVKNDEAVRLTDECSSLRAEIAVLREKCEASSGIVKALSSSYEKMKLELAAKPSQMVFLPEHSSEGAAEELAEDTTGDSALGITLEDLNIALTQDLATEVNQSEFVGASCGRRLRSKAPQPEPLPSDDAARLGSFEAAVANASMANSTASVVGSARRLRSKTAVENPLQKRSKTAGEREATDAD